MCNACDRIVRWMLEETDAPCEVQLLDYGITMKGTGESGHQLVGKVPCVVHKGAIVAEAAAICAYRANAFFIFYYWQQTHQFRIFSLRNTVIQPVRGLRLRVDLHRR